MNVRAARGAIVVPADDPSSLHGATGKLLEAILERNAIAHDDLISILFTATEDLSSAFPAEAARRMGLGDIPLIGFLFKQNTTSFDESEVLIMVTPHIDSGERVTDNLD